MTASATVLLLLLSVPCVSQTQVRIETMGRGIQLDGFLMEWQEEDAKRFAGDGRLLWDAENVPDGFAGYVTVRGDDSCRMRTVRLYPSLAAAHRYREMVLEAGPGPSGFYQVSEVESGGRALLSAEFVIPWDSVKTDSTGAYTIAMVSMGDCDTLGPMLVSGMHYRPALKVFTPKMWFRLTAILVLLAAYLVLYVRVRKTRSRKESPRR